MAVLFGCLSAMCLVYYGVIAAYSGIRTAFSSIWLILAAVLAVMAVLCRLYSRFKDRIPLSVTVTAVTAAAASFAVFVIVEAAMGTQFFSSGKRSVDYVIVLGTQVKGETLSRSLEYRMETAVRYAKIHPNTVFILSGGKGKGEDVSEAFAMYEYMKANGIPEYQMILEEQSTSTYENLVYSRLLIAEREEDRRTTIRDVMSAAGYLSPPDEEVQIHVGIITSNFHMLRAKGIAKKVGISDPYGICAKSDPVLFLHLCVRECFAILKDKFVGNM